MNKQEQIREGIAKGLALYKHLESIKFWGWDKLAQDDPTVLEQYYEEADKVISYLNSQGVVLKVEDWLPIRRGMVCTIEPLIKGDK